MIVIAEDDDDDFLLTQKAFQESQFTGRLHRVKDGEELMDFLLGAGRKSPVNEAGEALLILLDLNMPRKDGREALAQIKSHPALRALPVVILTTSRSQEDVARTYDLGVNSFIQKPFRFKDLLDAISALKTYWFDVVELPRSHPLSGSHEERAH